MEPYSERDLESAARFREGIHKEALVKLRRVHPEIGEVVDRWPIEAFFQQYWDYPGAWYTVVTIPQEFKTREAFVDALVRDTLSRYSSSEHQEPDQQQTKNRFAPSDDASGSDETAEPAVTGYPDSGAEFCIVHSRKPCDGEVSHRSALAAAARLMFSGGGEDEGWRYDIGAAKGRTVPAAALFGSSGRDDGLDYRRAFLYPPHGNGYTIADFAKVNAMLFPNGTDALEVMEWTTDWSDYFDEGHEWWGALCLTVYDRSMDRFVAIMASATD